MFRPSRVPAARELFRASTTSVASPILAGALTPRRCYSQPPGKQIKYHPSHTKRQEAKAARKWFLTEATWQNYLSKQRQLNGEAGNSGEAVDSHHDKPKILDVTVPGSGPGALRIVIDGHGATYVGLLWLRDSCQCPLCVNPHSGQKNFSTTDLPTNPPVSRARIADNGSIEVTWADMVFDPAQGKDVEHTSIFKYEEIIKWATYRQLEDSPHRLPTERIMWNRERYQSLLDEGLCRISYQDWVSGGEAFRKAFLGLARTGMIFVTDVPEAEDQVELVANKIGNLQHTFYGFTWDVRSKPQAENVAYTNEFLGLHQDLMYHVPIPRLQLLHCLKNSCEGGESLFSDGVRAAYELKAANADFWGLLKKPMVRFHYNKHPHFYEQVHPVIREEYHLIEATHWAPPFQAPFLPNGQSGSKGLMDWKRAARSFQGIISAEKNMIEVKLKPGECVIFDNWRVHHGRRQFKGEHGGDRWLKGAYISDQVYRAKLERVQRQPVDVADDEWLRIDVRAARIKAARNEFVQVMDLYYSKPMVTPETPAQEATPAEEEISAQEEISA
ncbi:hypothetical protein B0H66DRAFT_569121 [Apodospora peruviana]|uniref:Gamma-butyrobetaine dioxygenase n=1 Tax=Apodospora peruviana TaxID=516989 RepID=A0AAE0LYZ0_9PEZI|nr:hypothetical protein B0H66DRAFT_569121 [Apodospora peruviana]